MDAGYKAFLFNEKGYYLEYTFIKGLPAIDRSAPPDPDELTVRVYADSGQEIEFLEDPELHLFALELAREKVY